MLKSGVTPGQAKKTTSMNYQVSYLLLLAVFLLGSCTNQPNDKTTNTYTTQHQYPTSIDTTAEAVPALDGNPKKEDNLYTLYRDLWQNPIEVIQKMGDLEGKTVADIGAGPYGYFSIQLAARSNAGKILALDIDPKAIEYIENAKKLLPEDIGQKIETRLVEPEDPKLMPGEADIALVVNTAPYFADRVSYFRNLLSGLAPGGKVVVIEEVEETDEPTTEE